MRNSEKQRKIVKMLNYKHGYANKERLYTVWKNMKDRCNREKNKSYKNYGGRGIKVCEEWENDYVVFRNWAINNGYKFDSKFQECTIDRIDNDKGYSPENCRIVSNLIQSKNKQNSMNDNEKYKECVICHKKFKIKQRNCKGLTCSYKCAGKLRSLKMDELAKINLVKKCPICNNEFIIRDGHFNKRVVCSKKCANIWFSPIWKLNNEEHRVVEWAEKLNISSHCLLHRVNDLGWTIEKALTTKKRGVK